MWPQDQQSGGQAGRWTKYSIGLNCNRQVCFVVTIATISGTHWYCTIRTSGQLHALGMINMNILSGILQIHTLWKKRRHDGGKSRSICVLMIWTSFMHARLKLAWLLKHTYVYIFCWNFLNVLFTARSLFAVKSSIQAARIFDTVEPLV